VVVVVHKIVRVKMRQQVWMKKEGVVEGVLMVVVMLLMVVMV
jgi:hypothetical protein